MDEKSYSCCDRALHIHKVDSPKRSCCLGLSISPINFHPALLCITDGGLEGSVHELSVNGKHSSNGFLGDKIKALTCLSILRIESSSLHSFPGFILDFKHLTVLSLDNNHLTCLPVELFECLPKLTALSIANNELSCIPDTIGLLSHLTSLTINSNHLKALPNSIARLKSLKYLDASFNNIDELPWGVFRSHHLLSVNLSHNRIEELPSCCGNPSVLKFLDVSFNRLTTLPAWTEFLGSLEVLNLEENSLTDTSSNLELLSHICSGSPRLKKLNVAANNFSMMPVLLPKLRFLEWINLSSAFSWRQDNLLLESLTKLQHLWHLQCRNANVCSLPEEIGALTELRSLHLDGNLLRYLPSSFCLLKNLQNLNLSLNRLEILPEDFGNLLCLQSLNLSFNQLHELPSSIQKLQRLERLELQGNLLLLRKTELCSLLALQYLKADEVLVKRWQNEADFQHERYSVLRNSLCTADCLIWEESNSQQAVEQNHNDDYAQNEEDARPAEVVDVHADQVDDDDNDDVSDKEDGEMDSWSSEHDANELLEDDKDLLDMFNDVNKETGLGSHGNAAHVTTPVPEEDWDAEAEQIAESLNKNQSSTACYDHTDFPHYEEPVKPTFSRHFYIPLPGSLSSFRTTRKNYSPVAGQFDDAE